MFAFYRIVADPDTNTEEMKEFQYEETAETLPLKEKLEHEINNYEIYELAYVDRYYHCDRVENCYAISPSQSVFGENDAFVGYMLNGVLPVKVGEQTPVFRDVCGVTSITTDQSIRRKR